MIPVIIAGAALVGYAVGKNQNKIKKGAKKISNKHKENKAEKAKLKEQKKPEQLNNSETKAEEPVKETKEKKD